MAISSRGRALLLFALSTLLVVGQLGATLGFARSAKADELSLTGANVVDYRSPLYYQFEFVTSSLEIAQGTSTATGGCEWERSLELTGPGAIMEVEQQYDPSTCQMLLEVGVPTAASLDHWRAGDPSPLTVSYAARSDGASEVETKTSLQLDELVDTVENALQRDGGTDGPSDPPRWRVLTRSAYDDPLRWLPCDRDVGGDPNSTACRDAQSRYSPVNRVFNTVAFTPGGGCATKSGTTSVATSDRSYWYATGWNLDHENPDSKLTCANGESFVWSKQHTRFVNDEMCPVLAAAAAVSEDARRYMQEILRLTPPTPADAAIRTTTRFWPNYSEGRADGGSIGNGNPSKEGGCHQFLRYSGIHERVQLDGPPE